jgi:hypothetical protein
LVVTGVIIFSIDSLPATIHAISIITAIIIDAKYSILQCQYGCSLSGFLLESFIHNIVTKDDMTSLKLFTASRIMAMEFDKNQTIALKITNAILVKIQYKLTLIICLSLFIMFSVRIKIYHLNLAFL